MMSSPDADAVRWEVRLHSPILPLDVFLPFLAFQALSRFVPSLSLEGALAISAVFPIVSCLICLVRARILEAVGVTALAALAVSVVAALLGAGPRVAPLFISLTFGVVLLASLALRRPAFFLFARQVHAGYSRERLHAYGAVLSVPAYRAAFRQMTLVWGLVGVIEFAVQILLYVALHPPLLTILSTVLKFGSIIGVTAWTMVYARRRSRQVTGSGI
jgi:hypothetical protein